jgi:hypothetical protein
MRRRSLWAGSAALALALAGTAPASATMLANLTLTTAVTAQTTGTLQFGRGFAPTNALVQGTFTYGSGGTSADAWVQSSADGGSTWTDIAEFHFTTASARFSYNLSSLTPVTSQYTPTDGTLAANTAKDGMIGALWRVKYTTAGTYAGTTLRVDVVTAGLSP